MQRRKKTEWEKEENILFAGVKKNSEGKGGKYLAKENVTIAGQTNK